MHVTPFVLELWRRLPPALIDQAMAERIVRHLSSTGQAVHTAIAAATQHMTTQRFYVQSCIVVSFLFITVVFFKCNKLYFY